MYVSRCYNSLFVTEDPCLLALCIAFSNARDFEPLTIDGSLFVWLHFFIIQIATKIRVDNSYHHAFYRVDMNNPHKPEMITFNFLKVGLYLNLEWY